MKQDPLTSSLPSSLSLVNSQSPVHYILSSYRIPNLIIFILAACVNSVPIQTLASISSLVETQFQYSKTLISFCILLGPIMHPFMATPCNWIIDKFGVRIGCCIGGILVSLGVWARCLTGVGQPFWCILGAFLAAIGNLFILSSPTAFAIKWFAAQEVPKVIAVTVLINIISGGTGASIGGLVVSKQANIDEIRKFFIIEAIIVTIPFILFIILFRQKPPHPPSRSATTPLTPKQPYLITIKSLLKNHSYLKIVLSMSLSYGIFISFISILDESLKSLKFTNPNKITSLVIGSAMIMGIVSAFLFTHAIRATNQYKSIINLCLIGAFATFSLLTLSFSLEIQNPIVVAIMGGCAGFFVIPLSALFAMYSAELTYPTGQGSATGYLFAGAQTVGFVCGLVWIQIIDERRWTIYITFGFHAAALIVALLLNMSTKEILNKTNYQLGLIKNIGQKNEQNDEKLVQSLLSEQRDQQKNKQIQ